jgi:hypothetical protein
MLLSPEEVAASHFSIPDRRDTPKLTDEQKKKMYTENRHRYQTMKVNGSATPGSQR